MRTSSRSTVSAVEKTKKRTFTDAALEDPLWRLEVKDTCAPPTWDDKCFRPPWLEICPVGSPSTLHQPLRYQGGFAQICWNKNGTQVHKIHRCAFWYRHELHHLRRFQDHDNVVKIASANEQTLTIALRFSGPPLEALNIPHFSCLQAASMAVGFLSALCRILDANVVHRAVMPKHVFVQFAIQERRTFHLSDCRGLSLVLGGWNSAVEFPRGEKLVERIPLPVEWTPPEMRLGLPYGAEVDAWGAGNTLQKALAKATTGTLANLPQKYKNVIIGLCEDAPSSRMHVGDAMLTLLTNHCQ